MACTQSFKTWVPAPGNPCIPGYDMHSNTALFVFAHLFFTYRYTNPYSQRSSSIGTTVE